MGDFVAVAGSRRVRVMLRVIGLVLTPLLAFWAWQAGDVWLAVLGAGVVVGTAVLIAGDVRALLRERRDAS
ncbi:hypothetical protein [Actinoplanes couchii]|uniref:Integral membrane protein n=1 Tax=Actinoplanes couchii TaxID=403638 RepID=A0ABQ3XNL8_9ACTN|nr:hypothetical protein [Actinoplanes couchii]MDR6319673.1 hypothetical protein [Actinoplanes couchii]GID60107.1 hypothetical protein Aco03nite_085110 [Actinoplanes couchii]